MLPIVTAGWLSGPYSVCYVMILLNSYSPDPHHHRSNRTIFCLIPCRGWPTELRLGVVAGVNLIIEQTEIIPVW